MSRHSPSVIVFLVIAFSRMLRVFPHFHTNAGTNNDIELSAKNVNCHLQRFIGEKT
jgi:hypothetical protein